MLKIKLDHVALGLPAIADAEPFLEGTLGGVKAGSFEGSPPFGFMQWVFSGGGRIEVIYPIGEDGFLHRFFGRGGGSEARSDDALVFSWRDSPLLISVEVDPSAEPGPRCIELASPRVLELPAGEVPELGTRFVQR